MSLRGNEIFQKVSRPAAEVQGASEQDDNQDDNETRVREGKRVRRGKLPATDAAIPLWLSPLIVVSGLGFITLGIVLLVKVRNAEDEKYLLAAAKIGENEVSGAPSGPPTAFHALQPASRTETNLDMINKELSPPSEKGTPSDPRRVSKAWQAIGRGSMRSIPSLLLTLTSHAITVGVEPMWV
jgi:hypothetical protein